jgi:pyruvate/2-oxoglutarate dehydrogenase complex dihydrolipoamide dehydrogenase (E3) component
VKNGEDNYTVTYRAGSDGPEQTLEVGLVMMATGRHPRVAGLNLQVSDYGPTVTSVVDVCPVSDK